MQTVATMQAGISSNGHKLKKSAGIQESMTQICVVANLAMAPARTFLSDDKWNKRIRGNGKTNSKDSAKMILGTISSFNVADHPDQTI